VKPARALPFRDAGREDRLLSRLRQLAGERRLDPHEIERLFRVILEMSVARQRNHVRTRDETPLRVAYQGVEGSYSHLTAQRRYAGRSGGVLLIGCETFQEVATKTESGETDYGLLPIENTTAGSINETYEILSEGRLKIVGEAISQVVHCLLGLPGATCESRRTILSHPQALRQCRAALDRIPHASAIAEGDTAGAARKVRETGDPTVGAIAGEEAARLYGLEILLHGINTEAQNITRFVEIARESEVCPAGTPVKSSMILTLPHRPGALYETLAVFGARRINLAKLESRPIPGRAFEYRFYLDVEGHAAVPPLAPALSELEAQGTTIVRLGSYPAAV
ncbi:MAG: chorismate mutase, partial [Candidatus Eisenbacteria bacterium]|nr:chorismate mutase [Candidatus Latescibacterota bacterium]MBD3302879.1 chorismate mutase [Candidatus Eisenbacteria bacterium]